MWSGVVGAPGGERGCGEVGSGNREEQRSILDVRGGSAYGAISLQRSVTTN